MCFFLHVPTVETPERHSSLNLFLEQTSQGRIRVALIHRRNNMAALVNEEKLEQNCAQPQCSHRIVQSFRLEKTCKVIEYTTKPWPHLHIF